MIRKPTLDFLETIHALLAQRPLSTEVVEDAFDVALRGDPDNANPYISVYRSFRTPHHVKQVEMRVPEKGATRKDALVILDLRPEVLSVTQEDVRRSFGDSPQLELPNEAQPADTPLYFLFVKPWGTLRFGFDRSAHELLSTVVVDAQSRS